MKSSRATGAGRAMDRRKQTDSTQGFSSKYGDDNNMVKLNVLYCMRS